MAKSLLNHSSHYVLIIIESCTNWAEIATIQITIEGTISLRSQLMRKLFPLANKHFRKIMSNVN